MIKAGWKIRTTILDATLQPDLLREIWPKIIVHDAGALLDAPHRHIVQVVDRAFSLAMLDAGDPRIQSENKDKAKERRRHSANLRALHLCQQRRDHARWHLEAERTTHASKTVKGNRALVQHNRDDF
jgi:hypothetical protein